MMFIWWILNDFPFSSFTLFINFISVLSFIFRFQNTQEISSFNMYFGSIFEDGVNWLFDHVCAMNAQNSCVKEAIILLFDDKIFDFTGHQMYFYVGVFEAFEKTSGSDIFFFYFVATFFDFSQINFMNFLIQLFLDIGICLNFRFYDLVIIIIYFCFFFVCNFFYHRFLFFFYNI